MKQVFIVDFTIHKGNNNGFAQWKEPQSGGVIRGQPGAYNSSGFNMWDILYATFRRYDGQGTVSQTMQLAGVVAQRENRPRAASQRRVNDDRSDVTQVRS